MGSEWKPIKIAPLWIEIIVKYGGPKVYKSQPNNVGTAVQVKPGVWELGSFPRDKTPIAWMHLPK